jgi:hypothetical protein
MMRAVLACAVMLMALAGGGSAAMTKQEALEQLLPRLAGPDAPGEVLFSADFEDGDLAEWHADPGCTAAEAPGGGKCVRVRISGNDHEDFVLTKKIAVTPGHPIAVCWRERLVEGSQPLYLRVDFFDENGVTGRPYATQDRGRTGADWTSNAILVSSWNRPWPRPSSSSSPTREMPSRGWKRTRRRCRSRRGTTRGRGSSRRESAS